MHTPTTEDNACAQLVCVTLVFRRGGDSHRLLQHSALQVRGPPSVTWTTAPAMVVGAEREAPASGSLGAIL